MTSSIKRFLAAMLLFVCSLVVACPFAAYASENGRKNTTLALGALTGLLAAKGKWVPAAVAGVGTGIAYHNWQAEINARHRRQAAWRRHEWRLHHRYHR